MYAVSKILERIRTRGGQDKHSLLPLILCHLDRSYSDNYFSNFSRALYITVRVQELTPRGSSIQREAQSQDISVASSVIKKVLCTYIDTGRQISVQRETIIDMRK
jgi:hypothetical protein